jgi:carotenoid 1,2-hydratase
VDGRTPLRLDLRFEPAAGTEAIERNLGTDAKPHLWLLAAPDCRVHGTIGRAEDGAQVAFSGRGYHDHNAGSEELGLAMHRWHWGRVHLGAKTHVYYHSHPRPGHGAVQSLWITSEDGRVSDLRERPIVEEKPGWPGRWGVPSDRSIAFSDGAERLARRPGTCVDDGPFYRRWLSDFAVGNDRATGISELLDTRRLHHPWFNWMIPYRLKRPADSR